MGDLGGPAALAHVHTSESQFTVLPLLAAPAAGASLWINSLAFKVGCRDRITWSSGQGASVPAGALAALLGPVLPLGFASPSSLRKGTQVLPDLGIPRPQSGAPVGTQGAAAHPLPAAHPEAQSWTVQAEEQAPRKPGRQEDGPPARDRAKRAGVGEGRCESPWQWRPEIRKVGMVVAFGLAPRSFLQQNKKDRTGQGRIGQGHWPRRMDLYVTSVHT